MYINVLTNLCACLKKKRCFFKLLPLLQWTFCLPLKCVTNPAIFTFLMFVHIDFSFQSRPGAIYHFSHFEQLFFLILNETGSPWRVVWEGDTQSHSTPLALRLHHTGTAFRLKKKKELHRTANGEKTNTPEALLDVVSLGITGCSVSSRSLSDLSSSSDQGFLFFVFLGVPFAWPGGFLCLGAPDWKACHAGKSPLNDVF